MQPEKSETKQINPKHNLMYTIITTQCVDIGVINDIAMNSKVHNLKVTEL